MNNSFYLTFFIRKSRKKNCAGKCTIYLRLTYKGQRIESSTNLKIEHEKWSKTQHKAIGNSENSRTTNSCLEDLRNRIYTIYSNKVQSGEPFFVYDLHAELIGANLNGANLNGANLQGADLSNADLNYSNLFLANLTSANLNGADLSFANLIGAKLNGAILDNAIFKGVQGYNP